MPEPARRNELSGRFLEPARSELALGQHGVLEVHCSTILTAADVTVLNHIPVTSVARTLLDLTRDIGLPDPRVQFHVDPGHGKPPIRVDFGWPERRIAVDTDGAKPSSNY